MCLSESINKIDYCTIKYPFPAKLSSYFSSCSISGSQRSQDLIGQRLWDIHIIKQYLLLLNWYSCSSKYFGFKIALHFQILLRNSKDFYLYGLYLSIFVILEMKLKLKNILSIHINSLKTIITHMDNILCKIIILPHMDQNDDPERGCWLSHFARIHITGCTFS